jgi:hypothetical protein
MQLHSLTLAILMAAAALSASSAPTPPARDAALELLAGSWQPVRSGIDIARTEAGGVQVSYARKAAQAGGVALPIEPGRLAGLQRMDLEVEGGAGAVIVVALRAADGTVHSWPAQSLSAKPTRLSLEADRIALDRVQSGGRSAAFDAGLVAELRLVDISAYMGRTSGDLEWTLTKSTAQLGAAGASAEAAASSSGLEGDAESRFFQALVEGRAEPATVIPDLLVAALQDRDDARTQLLLGLAHLWIAAEGNRADPRQLEHLMLADLYFDRCAELDSRETRLPSWQVPVQLALNAQIGERRDVDEVVAPLLEAFAEDPDFHSFSVGMIAFNSAPESSDFQRGLRAMRSALDADLTDASVQNRPNWPHNQEGFFLLLADYEQRAGNASAALVMLDRIESVPEFEAWPFRAEVTRRRELWAAGESVDASGGWMQAQSCVICHRR